MKKECITEGRKIPLQDIREKLLKKQEPYLRKRNNQAYLELSQIQIQQRLVELHEVDNYNDLSVNEMREKLKHFERTRNLLVWLDNSTTANHGYLVCLVTCLYDPAVFLTDKEYAAKTGQNLDIQKIIEQPEVHFIARCGSSDLEQLLYSETRLQCIQSLEVGVHIEGMEFNDRMRFCHGDSPLRAFEAGQQKGGNYLCSTCGIHCIMVPDIDHALNCELQTLQDRQTTIMQGTIARRKSLLCKAKPLKGLSKKELADELASRRQCSTGTKKDLQDLLNKFLCGKQRVPALLIHNPEAPLEQLHLGWYEILPCEPLHDIGHHIENVLTELPCHLPDPAAQLINECIDLCLGNKDCKRTVDYRVALIKTASVCHQSGILSQEDRKSVV